MTYGDRAHDLKVKVEQFENQVEDLVSKRDLGEVVRAGEKAQGHLVDAIDCLERCREVLDDAKL